MEVSHGYFAKGSQGHQVVFLKGIDTLSWKGLCRIVKEHPFLFSLIMVTLLWPRRLLNASVNAMLSRALHNPSGKGLRLLHLNIKNVHLCEWRKHRYQRSSSKGCYGKHWAYVGETAQEERGASVGPLGWEVQLGLGNAARSAGFRAWVLRWACPGQDEQKQYHFP